MNTLNYIKLTDIVPNLENPRKSISIDELNELASSIKAVGLLQPITVRPLGEQFQIVCGHRRFKAAQMADLDEIPCIVRELTDNEAYEIMVTENLQRKDVDPFDESGAFIKLLGRNYDIDALAAKFGKSRSYIFSRIKLADLIDEFKKFYEKGKIDFSHCLLIARLSPEFQKRLLAKHYAGDYYDLSCKPVSELRKAISALGNELKGAIFDTNECERCMANTACVALFMEQVDATCTDSECFGKKSMDALYAKLKRAKEINPDFVILDDWDLRDISKGSWKYRLVEKLKAEGFILKTDYAPGYTTYKEGNESPEHDDVTAFNFGVWGFLGKKKNAVGNVSSTPRTWKIEWQLDRLANNREEELLKHRRAIAIERINTMTDQELSDNRHIGLENLMRAALYLIINDIDSSTTACGISGCMDNAAEEIAQLDLVKVSNVLAKFLPSAGNDDNPFIEEMFPDQFNVKEVDTLRRYLDEAKTCWHNYDEVTDEMVEEDLRGRVK